MSVLECLKWQNFSQAAEDHISTEGKSGVPRFDGDPSKLAEYGFRLRLNIAREKSMDPEQLKKLGPLGLRLIEGLRGPALQVARNLQIEKLSAEDGASYLLKGLQTSLQPRSKQEARDLYQAGAQVGGLLSRQSTEAMSNYVLRRRAWHSAMVDLDPELTLPEGIRTEQLLLNAGINPDQQLMVRTAINGDMTWNKVCDELIAQHSRLHEKEKGKGGFSWGYKGGKGAGKRKGNFFRSYYVEDGLESSAHEDQWENASQSLGGYEEFDGYYANDYEEETWEDEDVTYEVYASMLEHGLDEEDYDALAYAAEVAQAESEAYFMRQKAKGSGHSGFQGAKNFQVQGQLSFEEKKAKLQAVKNKTQCRKCGQYGHWQDDPACPKGSRKGKGKGGSGSSTTASGGSKGAKSSGKSGGKSGKADQAERRNQQLEFERAQSSLHQSHRQQADVSEDEMSDDLGFTAIQDEGEVKTSKDREAYLDLYLRLEKNVSSFEYRDAYHERWNEFFPGHPLFTESDKDNLRRWKVKASQGLPKLPEPIQDAPFNATSPQLDAQQQPSQFSISTPPEPTPSDQLPLSTADGGSSQKALAWPSCPHQNKTRQGSNSHVKILRCKDCGFILEKERIKAPEKMKTEDVRDCDHADKDFRGTTSTTWKWTCKKCGHTEKGTKRPGQTGLEASSQASFQDVRSGEGEAPCQSDRWCAKLDPGSGSLATGGNDDAMKVAQLMMSTLELQQELGVKVQFEQLDRIYNKCKEFVSRGRSKVPGVSSASSTTKTSKGLPSEADIQEIGNKTFKAGAHKGKTYHEVFERESSYSRSMVSKMHSGAVKDQSILEFARYVEARNATNMHSYMSILQPIQEEEDSSEPIVAVLDTGCNNSCHGDRWMARFQNMVGTEIKTEAADGRFRGVGGRVEVTCKRTIPVNMMTTDKQVTPGMITSIELQDSDALLLISSKAQKKLGLILDMSNMTAYSKVLDSRHSSLARKLRRWQHCFGWIGRTTTPWGEDSGGNMWGWDAWRESSPSFEFGESEKHDKRAEEAASGVSWSYGKGRQRIVEHHIREAEEIEEDAAEGLQDLYDGDLCRCGDPKLCGCSVWIGSFSTGGCALWSTPWPFGSPSEEGNFQEHRRRWSVFTGSGTSICGPWSNWQNVNMSKSQETYEKIMVERKKWYPVITWVADTIRSRLAKGREVLLENPWGSLLWRLRSMEKLIEDGVTNQGTGEALEVMQVDQCMYGLVGAKGWRQKKSTGLMVSSVKMKERLNRKCDGQHYHERLEGGNLTKRAQQWPHELCVEILEAAIEEMRMQVISFAFPAEAEIEDAESAGPMDGILDSQDIAESPLKRRKVDQAEVDREEMMEERTEATEDRLLHLKEAKRKETWLRLPKEKRVAFMLWWVIVQMRRSSGCWDLLWQVKMPLRRQSTSDVRVVRIVRPTRPSCEVRFNFEVAVDVFEVHDAAEKRHSILSVVDMTTHYHAAFWVVPGGTPSSRACAEAFNVGWLTPFGSPKMLTSDQGVHNSGRFAALLQAHGIEIRKTGARAPYQLGTTERHGGILKEIMKKAIHNRQLEGAETIAALCAECARTKNNLINHGGYSPVQWVLGHTPDDLTSLLSHDAEENLGIHQQLVDQEEEGQEKQESFMKQLLIRQSAKEAFMQVDTSQRIRKALLRKSVPMRGPYRTGDLVCFSKKGKWYGPARVLSNEGRSSLWLIHSGVTTLVPEVACRPASTEEILKKHVLELRPSTKRRRQLLAEDDEDEEDHLPFEDDGNEARGLKSRTDGTAPYLEVGVDEPSGGAQSGMAANPGLMHDESSPMEDIFGGNDDGADEQEDYVPTPAEEAIPQPPGLEHLPPDVNPSGSLSGQQQPEIEESPVVSHQTTEVTSMASDGQGVDPMAVAPSTTMAAPMAVGPPVPPHPEITAALRRSVDQLDGIRRANFAQTDVKEEKLWAFLASRQSKVVQKKVKKFQRTKKAGAGRELVYQKEEISMQRKLDETRTKEWQNWLKYSDGVWITEAQLKKMKEKDPKIRVIPTRWVDVNKAEVGQDDKLKSRLVVRGDLEDSSTMRTDSPTCSLSMISLTLCLSACKNTSLWSGDISAAFLQGSKLDRTLILSMPKGRIPGEPDGRYYMVSSTIYGTKDAPRGWFKNLHQTLQEKGFRPVPQESASYVLNDKKGELLGMVIVHVDDLLWTGGIEIEKKMQEVCSIYNFGKIEKDEFKYCGRDVKKDEKGIHVSCPSLIDRVKPVYLSADQRKQKEAKVPEEIRAQLRSIIGSLAWLVRVCRPDLAYAVSKLQSDVHQATFGDVQFANSVVKSKMVGITYPLMAFKFEEAMLVGIQDASFSNDHEVSKGGVKMGNRSQSGRLLCLGPPGFKEEKAGQVMLIEWHSTTLKRVCRSTMQAETLSLLHGCEEGEHLRLVFHGLWNEHHRMKKDWIVEAQDATQFDMYTDCKSLEQYVNQAGLHSVADKRLSIDLSGIRQLTWRRKHEEVDDPLMTDHAKWRDHPCLMDHHWPDVCWCTDKVNASGIACTGYGWKQDWFDPNKRISVWKWGWYLAGVQFNPASIPWQFLSYHDHRTWWLKLAGKIRCMQLLTAFAIGY